MLREQTDSVTMSLLPLPFLYACLLSVILISTVRAHAISQQISGKNEKVCFENSSLQEQGGQTAQVSLPNYLLLDSYPVYLVASCIFGMPGLLCLQHRVYIKQNGEECTNKVLKIISKETVMD
jgi:hypothetical protein